MNNKPWAYVSSAWSSVEKKISKGSEKDGE